MIPSLKVPTMTDTIVFLDHGSLAPGTVLRPPAFAHQWIDHDETKPGEVAARIKDATIVVSNKIKVGAAEMDAAPGLKLIAVCWPPPRNAALPSATCGAMRNIPCPNTPSA